MKLEEIVPPLELCKKIPVGEFEDSVFVWKINPDYMPKFQVLDVRIYPFIPKDGTTLYPAPTLQEIIKNSDPAYDWTAKNNPAASQSIIEEALKAWLNLKEIEKG